MRKFRDPCIKPTYVHDWDILVSETDKVRIFRCIRCKGLKFVTQRFKYDPKTGTKA